MKPKDGVSRSARAHYLICDVSTIRKLDTVGSDFPVWLFPLQVLIVLVCKSEEKHGDCKKKQARQRCHLDCEAHCHPMIEHFTRMTAIASPPDIQVMTLSDFSSITKCPYNVVPTDAVGRHRSDPQLMTSSNR